MKWLAAAAAVTVIVSAAGPAHAERVAEWAGTYSYTYDGGETAGGSPILQTWTLQLDDRACALRGSGFQLDESLSCSASAAADGLTIRFLAHADGRAVNAWGVAVYRPGQALFAMTRREGKLFTRWAALAPDEGLAGTTGVFFKKETAAPGR